jgi:hypothetical protein
LESLALAPPIDRTFRHHGRGELIFPTLPGKQLASGRNLQFGEHHLGADPVISSTSDHLVVRGVKVNAVAASVDHDFLLEMF